MFPDSPSFVQRWRLPLCAMLFLLLAAITVPVDHDEGQYLAATRLVAEGWRPYLDFPYLQTPLQPYLLAPLQWIAPGHLFGVSRLANALFVSIAAVLVGRTAAHLSGKPAAGPLAALLLLACDSIQFAGSVARNDALPLMLFALGLERLLGTAAPGRGRLFVAGLALAAAASAKISYALPTAAVALVLLLTELRRDPTKVASAYAGMALGALPTLAFLAMDPHRVWFQVVDYSVDAVRAFQTLNGSLDQLGWGRRLARFLKFAAMGALLPLLVGAFWALGREEVRQHRLLVAVFVMALIAALLPMPMYRQYLVPVVAPAILMAAASGVLARVLALREAILISILLLFFAVALFRGTKEAGEAARAGDGPVDTVRTARAVGDLVRKAGGRTIASLDAVTATDTGLELDRRFAPGPFLFRAGNLAACADRTLCPLTFASIRELDRAAPDALLTGSEAKEIGPLREGLDGPLVAWAKAHGYRPQPVGKRTLWLRP